MNIRRIFQRAYHLWERIVNEGKRLPGIFSDKTRYVLEDMEFSGTVYDLREDTPWANYSPTTPKIPTGSDGHFKKLDILLGRKP